MATKARGWGLARKSKPTKRYAEGGGVESDVPEGGRFAESDPDIYARARKWMAAQEAAGESEAPAAKPSTPKPSQAKPAAARAVAPAVAPAVGTGSGRGGRGGPTAEELEYDREVGSIGKGKVVPASEKGVDWADVKRQAYNTAMALPGLQGLRPVVGAARAAPKVGTALAERFDKITPIPSKASRTVQEAIETAPTASRRALPASADGEAAARLGGPSASPRIGGARAEPARLEAPKASSRPNPEAKAELSRNRKSPRARSRFNDDESGVAFAKGGAVRGDGIARRGKTKGRMI